MHMRNLACLLLCCFSAAFLQQESLAQGRLETSSQIRVRNPLVLGKSRKDKPQQTTPFEFKISIDPRRDYLGYYQEEGDLLIKCLFRNVSDKKQELTLKDHDPYFGDLNCPVGLTARVWDVQGTLLTKTQYIEDGWWWNRMLGSRGYMMQPGDTITLKPGEQVVRLVPLDIIVGSCPNFPKGVVAGTYTVQFRLSGNEEYLSNKLEIEVKGKEIDQ